MGMKMRKFSLFAGLLLLILCGCAEKLELEKKFISNLSVSEAIVEGELVVTFSGLCGHSAWGVDTLTNVRKQDEMILTLNLARGKRGDFEYKIKVPPSVSKIYLGSDILWKRDDTVSVK